MTTKVVQTFYISTGRKNAMYTLRVRRDVIGSNPDWMPDHYVRILAATVEKAQEKATAYVDAWKDRVGENSYTTIILHLDPDEETFKRRGKLSVKETRWFEDIENGVFPFGKFVGQPIDSASENYLLFFADKLINDPTLSPVMGALCSACMGVALEKGLIAKREEKREAKKIEDAKSNFVGEIGERRVFEGVVQTSFLKDSDGYGGSYYINRVKIGDDIVTYMGNKLGEKGETIKFKATVYKHSEYKGVKSTQVKRPSKL